MSSPLEIALVATFAAGGTATGFALFPLTGRDSRTVLPGKWRVYYALLTGVLCGLVAWRFGLSWELLAYSVLPLFGVFLGMIDLRFRLLPNALLLPFLLVTTVLLLLTGVAGSNYSGLLEAVVGGVSMFSIYLVMALASPGIGMGDVKLAGVLGLYGGYAGVTPWLVTLLGGFILGGLLSAVVLVRGGSRKAEIPFGPCMLAATMLAIFVPA